MSNFNAYALILFVWLVLQMIIDTIGTNKDSTKNMGNTAGVFFRYITELILLYFAING